MQVILVTDVVVNLAVGISEYPIYGRWTMPGPFFQAPFMVFLFAIAPFVLGKPRVAEIIRLTIAERPAMRKVRPTVER